MTPNSYTNTDILLQVQVNQPPITVRHSSEGQDDRSGHNSSQRSLSVVVTEPRAPVPSSNSDDDLFLNFRVFLIFGKFIGLVPIEGLLQRDYSKLKFRKQGLASLINLTITLALLSNVAMGLWDIRGSRVNRTDDIAWSFAMFAFYGTSTFMYIYCNYWSPELIQIIRKWNNLQIHFTQPDITLFRDTNLLAGIVITSAVLENACVTFKNFPLDPGSGAYMERSENRNISAWEIFYKRSNGQWAAAVPYNFYLCVFLLVCNKLAFYGWNFVDVAIALLARAVYFKFKALYFVGEASLINENKSEADAWHLFTKDHEKLCGILHDIRTFLSPLIFVSFGANIYFICMQFHNRLNPYEHASAIASVYAWWSIFHLIFRLFFICITGARINDWAHQINYLFQRCPNDLYSMEIERTEKFVNSREIGLTGLGCFIITKSLMLRVAGVCVTFQMVLLQALQTSLQNNA